MRVSKYHGSFTKRFLDIFFSFIFLGLSMPVVFIICLIQMVMGPPIFFIQLRTGRASTVFKIVKFRTMIVGAEKLQKKYQKNNESDGPVFKIENDPRFTKFGKILSRTGLDELPQFINVLRGEMSIVGPRPLPVYENEKLSRKYKVRNLVKPGITSSWVVNGSHKLSFRKWMELDRKYVERAVFTTDLKIILDTSIMMLGSLSSLFKTIDLNSKSN